MPDPDGSGGTDITIKLKPQHPSDLSFSSTASGANHFIDLLKFEASFPDLIAAFWN
jgi:hypothetical protein